ncbi:hypothetical protein HU200_013039 [Digitaria exilis]|uniref:Uncharacterized protein n=1 Tax=Digitaria exilis TaxID=1010633 RepID=A0A835FDR0_9POAL|nr:hypothetical protein HU200_013039 [Digitaria exilis]
MAAVSELQAQPTYVHPTAASSGVQSMEERRWLCRVQETLEQASAEGLGAPPKVFDVPRTLRDTKPDAYAPRHFALGPYHYGRPELKDMERYKLAAAKRSEARFAGGRKIGHLAARFHGLQGEIRGPYHRVLELSDETLAWMMAIDTCFLLDFLLGYYHYYHRGEGEDDTVVSTAPSWISATVRDAMMLENQLPLVLFVRNLELRHASELAATDVLHAVLDRFIKDVCPIKICAEMPIAEFTKQAHLLELLYHFLVPNVSVFEENSEGATGSDHPPPHADQEEDEEDPEKQIEKVKQACLQVSQLRIVKDHLISRPKNLIEDSIRKVPALAGLVPVIDKMVTSMDVEAKLKSVNLGNLVSSPLANDMKIPSASELARCGVRFAPAPEGIAGIAFDEKTATLSLPVVTLDCNTETILRNIVAYEAVAVRGVPVVARYTEVMSGIIAGGTGKKDVKFLERSGVLVNRMKSQAEAAGMWSGMCVATTRVSEVPRLDAVIRAVNAHRDRTASVRARKLFKKYVFGSWKILTLLASASLLLMTALQTFCSTYPCQSTWFGRALQLP